MLNNPRIRCFNEGIKEKRKREEKLREKRKRSGDKSLRSS